MYRTLIMGSSNRKKDLKNDITNMDYTFAWLERNYMRINFTS